MPQSPNFGIRHLETTDGHDELVVAQGQNLLDQRLSDQLDLVIAADANITLTNPGGVLSQLSHQTIRLRDPNTILTSTRQLIFPALTVGRFIITNQTGQSFNVVVSGSAAPAISVASGVTADLVADGTDMLEIGNSTAGGGGGSTTSDHDAGFFFAGKPTAGAEAIRIIWNQSLKLAANMPQSRAVSRTVTTAATSYDVQKNGVSIGTINFALGAAVATFSSSSDTYFFDRDVVGVIAPNPQDATQDNIGIVLHLEKI